MGLDILIATDADKEIYAHYRSNSTNNNRNKHSLSRTFCNFMCRQNLEYGEPELDQIGRITNQDISPLYEMEKYQDENDEGYQYLLEIANSEEERLHILDAAKASREKLSNNIHTILALVNALIQQLAATNNLHQLLQNGGNDTLGYTEYFTNFNNDTGDGYIGNNFGQDLRNMKSFLEFAKEKGATTVYFRYG